MKIPVFTIIQKYNLFITFLPSYQSREIAMVQKLHDRSERIKSFVINVKSLAKYFRHVSYISESLLLAILPRNNVERTEEFEWSRLLYRSCNAIPRPE